MDLYKEWDNLNKTKFNTTLTQKEIMEAITHESQLSLAVLKKRLKAKMYWILSFTAIAIIWMLASLHNIELLMILSVSLLINIAFLVPIILNYKKIQSHSLSTLNTSEALKSNISVIKKVLRLEFIIGLFGMPASIITGLLVSNNYKGHSLADAINNPQLLLIALIGFIIFVPLGVVASMKMNAFAFGKHLNHLQDNVNQLETLN